MWVILESYLYLKVVGIIITKIEVLLMSIIAALGKQILAYDKTFIIKVYKKII